MKRAFTLVVLLTSAGAVFAAGNHEIRCALMGSGSGESNATIHMLRYAVGAPVVGRSSSSGHELIHGPIPCRREAVTAVTDGSNSMSRVLRMDQNAPNPFNPSTTIAFSLPADVPRVRLAVYDVSGRLVRTLVDGPQPAGERSVAWNGRDDAGSAAASGVYYYRLDTPQGRITRKMTLLK